MLDGEKDKEKSPSLAGLPDHRVHGYRSAGRDLLCIKAAEQADGPGRPKRDDRDAATAAGR